jgi:hypothetical protein
LREAKMPDDGKQLLNEIMALVRQLPEDQQHALRVALSARLFPVGQGLLLELLAEAAQRYRQQKGLIVG